MADTTSAPPLATAFAQAWNTTRTARSAAPVTASAEMERRLAALLARARAVHPALAVDDLVFVGHLGRCAACIDAGPLETAESLAVGDLLLACACALGVPGAAAGFAARCDQRLRAALVAVVKSDHLRDEMEQHVRDVLLIGGVKGEPKIAEYRGQSPLPRWVGVVAQGLAISVVRVDQAEKRARDAIALAVLSARVRPEVELVRHQYRTPFETALAAAIEALDPRGKMLLRLQLVRGVSVEKIGKMYGVSQSTASRWLAEARETIREQLDRAMRAVNISRDELPSLAGIMASDLDLSMSRLLAATSRTD